MAGRGARRWLAAVCAGLLLAAGALEGAARLPWFTAQVDAVGRGAVGVTATGADLVPGLTGVALFGAAAVAAAVAVAGPVRRVLGGLVAAAGIWAAATVGRLLLAPPTAADLSALPAAPAGGTPSTAAVAAGIGPLPAALGALLLVAVGVTLAAAERRLPRLGARFTTRPAPERAEAADPDRAAWDALDAGHDPTAGSRADLPGATRPGRTDGEVSGRPV